MTETATALVYVPCASAPIPEVERIGGKARALARLAELASAGGFEVPRFAVVTTEACHASEDARRAVEDACRAAGLGGASLAVRSSAVVEDSASRSYAGLFESVLGVPYEPGRTEALWQAIGSVWRSASAARTKVYGGRDEGATRMAVVIQEMVEPEASGVAFSVDPVTERDDVAVVSAVLGLGQGLLSGELDADSHWVTLDGAITTRLAVKERALRVTDDGGTEWRPVAEEASRRAAITDPEVRRIAACARFLAQRLGAPQDIEWAIAERDGERRLVLLQSRPVTPKGVRKASGPAHVWDNSNIVESYPGVTSPLTFSFARMVYEEVYRQFCRLLGVPERTLEECRPVFANMLGHVRGRVYYDLLNWYRTIALLPGYQLNREFMERMMGVREKLDNAPPPPASRGRFDDSLRFAGSALRILIEDARLGSRVPAFFRRVDQALQSIEDRDFSTWTAEEAIVAYRSLESQLLRNWRTPIVNDFSAMIWFGILCRVAERWLPDLPPSVVNDLLCGETGIRSTEPARRVMALARRVRDDERLSTMLAETTEGRARWARLEQDASQAPFLAEVRSYLREFGDRCIEELKLETVPPRDDPGSLLDIVVGYEQASLFDGTAGREREKSVRAAAEREVLPRLAPWKRLVFRVVLARARRRVRDRENLRFERTRVFGAVRRIFNRLGRAMAERGALDQGRDIFYLTVSEVFDFFDGRLAADETRSRARALRAQFEAFAREPAPPPRFASDDDTPPSPSIPAAAAPAPAEGGLQGIGCCPGVVRAPVRVVRDPSRPGALGGAILVAERTDPGWTLLFPLASGLLVERGSLLSHSAIVAREIGLPCVVGIPDLLRTLHDGEEVEMDGARGTVRRLSRPASA